MVNTNKIPKYLRCFIYNRKGTAEVIGSVLFIIILMFAFSSIYLWHDNAVKSMNTLLSDKLNSQIELHWLLDKEGAETSTLVVTNTGGVGTSLSRLWIVTGGQHQHFELTGSYVGAGESTTIDVSAPPISHSKSVGDTYSVLTTLGNMASPKGLIKIVDSIGGGGGGSAAIGSVIIVDYSSFVSNIYDVDSDSLYGSVSGYHITLDKTVAQHLNKYDIEFKVKLSNTDINDRSISIKSGSQMFLIGSKNTGGNIVSYVGLPLTNEITISGKGDAEFVSFRAVLSDFGLSSGDSIYALNLVLVGAFDEGTVNEAPLGQNIPFVAIRITLPS